VSALPAGAAPLAAPRVSFLDPYAANRRVSLITWLRLLVWLAILGLGGLLWWW
jgi:hypothetical protein